MANIVVANLQTFGLSASAQGYDTSTVFGWINNPPSGPDAFIDGNNGPDGGNPYMWGHVLGCLRRDQLFRLPVGGGQQSVEPGARHRRHGHVVKAGDVYGQTGCFLSLSYNQDSVVAQKWLTGVPESQNIGANEWNFSLLGIAK